MRNHNFCENKTKTMSTDPPKLKDFNFKFRPSTFT